MDYLQYYYVGKKQGAKAEVLNLVINGLPSIPWIEFVFFMKDWREKVLNLVINGLPSIQKLSDILKELNLTIVLNLVINGLPSILNL